MNTIPNNLPVSTDKYGNPFNRVVTAAVGKGPTRTLRRYGLTCYTDGSLPSVDALTWARIYADSWILNQGTPDDGLALIDRITDEGYTICIGNPGIDTNVWHTDDGIDFLRDYADCGGVIEMKMFKNGLKTFFGTPHKDESGNTVGVFCSSVGMYSKYPNNGTVEDAISDFPDPIREKMLAFANIFEEFGMPWGSWEDENGNPCDPGVYPIPLEMDERTVNWLELSSNTPDRTDLLAACSKPGDPEAAEKKAFFDKELWRYVLSIAVQHWCDGFIGLDGVVYLITLIDETPAAE